MLNFRSILLAIKVIRLSFEHWRFPSGTRFTRQNRGWLLARVHYSQTTM